MKKTTVFKINNEFDTYWEYAALMVLKKIQKNMKYKKEPYCYKDNDIQRIINLILNKEFQKATNGFMNIDCNHCFSIETLENIFLPMFLQYQRNKFIMDI